MVRLFELVLLAAPFVAYAFWRVSAGEGGPSTAALLISATSLFALIASLLWWAHTERLPPGEIYIPPRIEDGRLLPAGTARQ